LELEEENKLLELTLPLEDFGLVRFTGGFPGEVVGTWTFEVVKDESRLEVKLYIGFFGLVRLTGRFPGVLFVQ